MTNVAQDYDTACKIRAFISALESAEDIDEVLIDWAKKKADWFDPIIARNDEVLGECEYEENEDKKVLKKFRYF